MQFTTGRFEESPNPTIEIWRTTPVDVNDIHAQPPAFLEPCSEHDQAYAPGATKYETTFYRSAIMLAQNETFAVRWNGFKYEVAMIISVLGINPYDGKPASTTIGGLNPKTPYQNYTFIAGEKAKTGKGAGAIHGWMWDEEVSSQFRVLSTDSRDRVANHVLNVLGLPIIPYAITVSAYWPTGMVTADDDEITLAHLPRSCFQKDPHLAQAGEWWGLRPKFVVTWELPGFDPDVVYQLAQFHRGR
jgi:hypothetical protein